MTKPYRTAGQPITSVLTVLANERPGIHKGEAKIKKYLTKLEWEGNTDNNSLSGTTVVAVIKTSISIPAVYSYEIDLNFHQNNCFPNRENTCLCP